MPEVAAPAAISTPADKAKAKPAGPRDQFREIVETVVFVVALVLMLKLFVVEAFVIPTGSMAETLYGYQKIVTCPECGFEFPVNSSNEVDPQDGLGRKPLTGANCPNCRHRFEFKQNDSPPNRSGDRVLVHKAIYEFESPQRGDVVVFKYPVDPQIKQTAQNYIKRLWGFGGETLAINRGDLYATRALEYPATALDAGGRPKYPRPADPARLWEGPYPDSKVVPAYEPSGIDGTYHNAEEASEFFDASRAKRFPEGSFGLLRKTDDQMLAMRRIVYDNDRQSTTLAAKGVPPRWLHDAGWTADNAKEPKSFAHTGDETTWLRYRHLFPKTREEWEQIQLNGYKPELISPGVVTNFMGYNAGAESSHESRRTTEFWVPDLMLECKAEVKSPTAEVTLELSKGPNRYRAVFAGGQTKLIRVVPGGATQEIASVAGGVPGPGTYGLRFANFDCRLRVWVNGKPLNFGPAADYTPDPLPDHYEEADQMKEGWTSVNDVAAPASVAVKGDAVISKLVLWRDSYFTYSDNVVPLAGVAKYAETFFVQPGHYMCLGDNSSQSSDSRKWGTVPERLMLGKAVFVFFPFDRIGFIK